MAIGSVIILAAISWWSAYKRQQQRKQFTDLPFGARVSSVGHSEGIQLHDSEAIDRYIRRSEIRRGPDPVQIWMTVVVTLAIGAAALYIVLSDHYGQDSVKWAFGSLGTVVGYWLKR